MRRVLFRIGRLRVYSYPVMLYLGLVIGLVAGSIAAQKNGLEGGKFLLATFVLFVPALVGARLQHVLTHWSRFRNRPVEYFRRPVPGVSIIGAAPITMALVWPVMHLIGLPAWRTLDAAVFVVLPCLVFLRIGCHLHGCCAGRPSRHGLLLPDVHGICVKRIPVQLMDSCFTTALFAWAWMQQDRWRDGLLFCACTAAWTLGRLCLYPIREQAIRRPIPVTNIAAVLACLLLYAVYVATRLADG